PWSVGSDPVLPQAPSLAVRPRVRIPSPDVREPIALPFLGQRRREGFPAEDPTAEWSLSAALAAPLPTRTSPAPFLRLNLPEPYESRQPGSSPKGSEEESLPRFFSPQVRRP